MSIWGVDSWMRYGETFSVYFSLIGRIGPLKRSNGHMVLRWPFSGLVRYDPPVGIVLFVSIMIGVVSFDGLQEGPVWSRIGPELQTVFTRILDDTGARLLSESLGLVITIAIIWGFYRAGIETIRYATRKTEKPYSAAKIAQQFAPSLIPIGIAYLGAHFITLLLIEGQSIVSLISDPLGFGWNLFGTQSSGINIGLIGAENTWYLQVSLIVSGHIAGLALAHNRALELWSDPKLATRSQFGMLAIMVSLTSFALWLLAKANA